MTEGLTVAVVALTIAVAAAQPPRQSPSVDRMRTLADADSSVALTDVVRSQPDAARELLRRTLVEATARPRARADSALLRAQRVANAIERAWNDSFPRAQVERFVRMPPVLRRAKIESDSARWRGNAALGRAGPDSAVLIWRDALRQSKAIPDTAGIAATLGNIGAGFYAAEQLDSAEVYLNGALRLADAIGDRVTAQNALGTLGSIARDRGELGKAQSLYTSALALRATVGDRRGQAADHNNLGLLSADVGDVNAARTHFAEALTIAREHALDNAEATTLLNLANLASVGGEYAVASRQYDSALAIYRANGSDLDAGLVLHNLGLLASRRGDYTGARLRLEQALRIFTRAGRPTDVILVRADLASIAAATGDLQGALSQLAQAERLVQAGSADPELAAEVALARAEVTAQLNALPEAERQYTRAEALFRAAGNTSGVADAQQGRALLLAARRQFPQALALLRRVVRSHAAAEERRPAAVAQLMTGHVLHLQGDLPAARRALDSAVSSLAALHDPAGEAAALSALGDVELDAGSVLVADSLYRRGLARLAGRSAPGVSWGLHAGRGRALRRRGMLAESAAALRAAVADIERMATTLATAERRAGFLADKWDAYGQLALVERSRGDLAAAFVTSERLRARQMLDVLARGRVPGGESPDSALVVRAEDARRRVAELTARLEREEGDVTPLRGTDAGRSPSAVTREALARAHEEYEAVLVALRETESSYGRITRSEVATWRDVSRRLERGEALVQYLTLDSASIAFVVTPDTLRVVELPVDRKTLADLVEFTREMLKPPSGTTARSTSVGWRQPLRRLHGHLVAPIEESGILADVRRLIIVPNVELHYLPFAALLRSVPGSSRGEEFLIERYEIGYAPSASVWVRLGDRPLARTTGVLALAPRGQALPGSVQEVEAIRELYGSEATVLTGRAATEAAFRARAGRHGIVHLATVGVLNKHNPLFSFVSLQPDGDADGRLEVHEVFALTLNARLLVLSACQTALGSGALSDVPPGDDWVGLVRAFLGAGAANVIATLWPVEDRSTARAMTHLHRSLRRGDTEISALAAAQRAMLHDPATADPFHWAGFVLVGGR